MKLLAILILAINIYSCMDDNIEHSEIVKDSDLWDYGSFGDITFNSVSFCMVSFRVENDTLKIDYKEPIEESARYFLEFIQQYNNYYIDSLKQRIKGGK